MKKVLLIITILGSFSCSKDVIKYCWECTIVTSTIVTSYSASSQTETVNKCDWTEQDAEDFEKKNTSSYNGVSQSTSCRKI